MKGIDLVNHPNFVNRKDDLDPNQPGLLKIAKKKGMLVSEDKHIDDGIKCNRWN